jgi:hypothetical protein
MTGGKKIIALPLQFIFYTVPCRNMRFLDVGDTKELQKEVLCDLIA